MNENDSILRCKQVVKSPLENIDAVVAVVYGHQYEPA
jgi:hypothetical protein